MLTMDKALLIIEEAKAKKIGQPMNIAIVDAGANLMAFMRMDGVWLGSIDIAINKAFTAKAFDITTLELGRNSQPGDQFFGAHASNHGRDDDLRRRHPDQSERPDRRRRWRQRRQRRAGPRGGRGSGRCLVVVSNTGTFNDRQLHQPRYQ
jgi:hypothetical protein